MSSAAIAKHKSKGHEAQEKVPQEQSHRRNLGSIRPGIPCHSAELRPSRGEVRHFQLQVGVFYWIGFTFLKEGKGDFEPLGNDQ